MSKFLAIFALLTFSLSACTQAKQVGCQVETSISTSFAAGISSALTCSHQDVIQADLLAALGKTNLCTQAADIAKLKSVAATPIFGSILCPIAVQTALSLMASKIPDTWGCSPTATIGTLSDLLNKACLSAIGN